MERAIGCKMEAVDQMIRHAVWSAGASGIVLGVSGGIDSAVAAAFSARAVGPERVVGVCLPSAVTRPEDLEDAQDLCRSIGIEYRELSIEPVIEAYRGYPGLTETPYLAGNLMARTRMAILYAIANREGRLVCGTSNRTEYMLGYCTKHGDSAADIQPILHLYKTEVFAVGRALGIVPRISKNAFAAYGQGRPMRANWASPMRDRCRPPVAGAFRLAAQNETWSGCSGGSGPRSTKRRAPPHLETGGKASGYSSGW